MISVAMTVWNSPVYLEEQLSSLLEQTRPADEVIIVNDASTDDTEKRVRTFIETHVCAGWKLITLPRNQGYIGAFGKALEACHGDWIFLCDHDDVWKPDKIDRMMETILAFPEKKQPDGLFCSFDLIDAKGDPIASRLQKNRANQNLIRRPLGNDRIEPIAYEDLAAFNTAPGCTCAFSKSVVRLYLRLFAKISHLPHDYALLALCALRKGVLFVNLPLVSYRQHGGNTLGLSRVNAWRQRSEDAALQALQKEELAFLCREYGGAFEKQKAALVSDLFCRRAQALEKRSVRGLLALMNQARSVPTLPLTIAQDLRVVVRKRFSGRSDAPKACAAQKTEGKKQ